MGVVHKENRSNLWRIPLPRSSNSSSLYEGLLESQLKLPLKFAWVTEFKLRCVFWSGKLFNVASHASCSTLPESSRSNYFCVFWSNTSRHILQSHITCSTTLPKSFISGLITFWVVQSYQLGYTGGYCWHVLLKSLWVIQFKYKPLRFLISHTPRSRVTFS